MLMNREVVDGSLPLRERGLKSIPSSCSAVLPAVAPLAGAWIEIQGIGQRKIWMRVAPLAGAWIEISKSLGFVAALIRRSPCGSVD